MIIDCHGHYTTAPTAHDAWRAAQTAAFKTGGDVDPAYPDISDDEIRETIEHQPAAPAEGARRGHDHLLPRASTMAHHVGDEAVSQAWTRRCNDLIKRVVDLYPETFIGVCQLPQSPGVSIAHSIAELERCVTQLGFVGCNLNPDPSGGHWTAPPLTDRAWYPFFEKMVELDVPAMVHVSGSCNHNFHATGAHYINADTTAFMQFLEGDLFADFPDSCASSSRTAAARCPITGAAIAAWRTCSRSRRFASM
jgi:4-oxalmesaconate hydratase